MVSVFARRYLRSRGCFPFLRVLRCFSSPGSLPAPMHSGRDDPQRAGFPHSDILGSQLASNSPRLFAGSHVFHRLSTPRHPPYALAGLFMLTRSRRPHRSRGTLAFPGSPEQPLSRIYLLASDKSLGVRLAHHPASLVARRDRTKTTITSIRLSKILTCPDAEWSPPGDVLGHAPRSGAKGKCSEPQHAVKPSKSPLQKK